MEAVAPGHVPNGRYATRARSRACVRGTWSASKPRNAGRVACATPRNVQIVSCMQLQTARKGRRQPCRADPCVAPWSRPRRRRPPVPSSECWVVPGSRRKTVQGTVCPTSPALNAIKSRHRHLLQTSREETDFPKCTHA